MLIRNRFLNTASFLSGPNDKPGEGGAAGDDQNNDNGGGDDTATGADDTTGQQDDGGDGDAESSGEGADDEGGEGEAGGAGKEDETEDDELAGLTPEQRKKVEAKLAKETGWRDRQLNKLYAKTRSAQEDVRAAATITGKAKVAPGETLTAEQIEARARELAAGMTAQEKYDNDANAAHAAGVAAYGDKWNSTLAKLPKLGGIDVNDMVDVLATDHPEVALYSLSDPDTYERVMSLPPAKRRTEIIKLGMKEPPKRKTEAKESKRPAGDVPAPVNQVRGGRQTAAQTVNIYDDKVNDDAWYAARNAARRRKFTNVE